MPLAMEFSEGVKCHKCADGKYSDDRDLIKCNANCCERDTRTRFKDKSKYNAILHALLVNLIVSI